MYKNFVHIREELVDLMPAIGLLTLMYPEFIRLNDPDNEKYMYGPQRLDFVRVCTSVLA